MSVRIYNETEDTYESIAAYIAAYDADDTDVFYVQFLYKLSTLFETAKKRTAFRGRAAMDDKGNSLIDKYAITDDEEDFFDEMLEMGSGELFRKLTAWAKNVFNSYQYKVLHDFGEEFYYKGDVNTYQSGGGFTVIEDYDAAWTDSALVDFIFEVLSGPYKDSVQDILTNGEQVLSLDGVFGGSILGESFEITATGETTVEESSLQYFINMPDYPYLDLFESVEAKLNEALVLYTIKEWYLTNRFMDDFQIENARYEVLSKEIKNLLMMRTKPPKRNTGLMGSSDY